MSVLFDPASQPHGRLNGGAAARNGGAQLASPHCLYFSKLLSAQREGRGVLPHFLGLQPLEFIWLTQSFVPDALLDCDESSDSQQLDSVREKGELRQQLLELRRDEWNELRELLMQHRAGFHPLEAAMASAVAAGCLGGDHLWRDLGLPTRGDLRELLTLYFPTLAVKNSKDMKWKKFFYKQLCEQEGGYVCRAPTCEECAAYDDCFGEEL